MYMVQNPNPEAVIQVEKITGSVLSNLECFSEKCWKTKNINKKVLKTLGFQHFFIWQGYKDSNLGHAVLETADKILCNPHEYYVFGQGDSCVLQFVLQFLKMLI